MAAKTRLLLKGKRTHIVMLACILASNKPFSMVYFQQCAGDNNDGDDYDDYNDDDKQVC